ncbi:MAG: hypothetical protein HY986_01495 [Candidatus Melainabacteria bacterium]|nr:hypothetical protein [Candidatus Melainabacteria bacterium]
MTISDSHKISNLQLSRLEAGCTPLKARRRVLEEGQIIHMPVSGTSRLVLERAWQHITEVFGAEPRQAHKRLKRPEFLRCVSEAKQVILQDQELRNLLLEILCSTFNSRPGIRFDPPRLRVVPPWQSLLPEPLAPEEEEEEEEEEGAYQPVSRSTLAEAGLLPLFSTHRDTFYANPQSQINIWLALHDVGPQDSFRFYPQYFHEPVANDSHLFNYDIWKKDVGFGKSQSNHAEGKKALYPQALDEAALKNPAAFSLKEGEAIAFAAAHLHGTNPHCCQSTRFSLDMRAVEIEDLQPGGLQAPNRDNKSQGSSLQDYLKLED